MSTQAMGRVCPYCRAGFEPEDEVKPCPACGTPHHADCFAENGGCTIFGCSAAPPDDAKISVTTTELHPPPPPSGLVGMPGSSIYHLQSESQPIPSGVPVPPPPPPPMPGGAVPLMAPPFAPSPYTQQYSLTGQPVYASNYAYSYDNYAQPKSRVVFVLLAIFLGMFGAHNFYTGYNKKAAIQLCLTVLTCFFGALVSWIWAIVEACTVTMDDDGVMLS